MTDLLRRILEAEAGIRVVEIVAPDVMLRLPPLVRRTFGRLEIDWREDREIWGLSFFLGEKSVELGHFSGHHIAMHPEYLGVAADLAEWIVLREIEGTLLHELGHALYAAAEEADGKSALQRAWREALDGEGWPSTYGIGDVREGAAEVFRWWIVARRLYAAAGQARLARALLQAGEARLVGRL